jgi:hypothetical protein
MMQTWGWMLVAPSLAATITAAVLNAPAHLYSPRFMKDLVSPRWRQCYMIALSFVAIQALFLRLWAMPVNILILLILTVCARRSNELSRRIATGNY